jgi:hypothetical protein
METRVAVVVERAGHLAVASRPSTDEVRDVEPGRDRKERVVADGSRSSIPAPLNEFVVDARQMCDDLLSDESQVGMQSQHPDGMRRLVLVVPRTGRSEDPTGVEAVSIRSERVDETEVRELGAAGRERCE